MCFKISTLSPSHRSAQFSQVSVSKEQFLMAKLFPISSFLNCGGKKKALKRIKTNDLLLLGQLKKNTEKGKIKGESTRLAVLMTVTVGLRCPSKLKVPLCWMLCKHVREGIE